MAKMKTDALNDFDRNDICKSIGNSFYDDVPNLGSVITLDNKGRLINSQFSKPSSSQTLLKLNFSEEVPDADDLPYSVISYGDTANAINLPYNDHNYVGTLSNKTLENYDKKALEFTSKQTGQYTNRSTFPPPTNLRISHFSNFNTNHLSQSDFINNRQENIFFNEKPKSNNQFSYTQTINSLTPLITNKSLNNQSQPNGFVGKKQILPNAIVINSNSVNKVKSVSVIKLQRPPNLENNSIITEPRIINIPIKKPNLTNVVANEVISSEINSSCDKTTDKTINLIPRCVCGYTHDDGGLIRCEICQTWQHIICMYPDNKFPILYKCEKCEPRIIDYSRAVSTQTKFLIKMKLNPTEFLVNHDFQSYDSENNTENTHSKCHTPQYVIVQPELKTPFKHIHESVHNSQNQIMFTNSKDSQLVPPGSPRTSKRKQDLISLKTVLTKPNSVGGSGAFTVNNIVIHNPPKSNSELQNNIIENQLNYNCYSNYLIPTSANSVKIDKPAFFTTINEISGKLKALFFSRIQTHTNLSIHQEQFLKLNNYTINSNCSCKVIKYNNNQTVIKSIKELNCSEVIMEFNGFISLSEDYNKEFDYRKHYNPFVLFYEKFDHLSLAIDAISKNCDSKYIRRSCTPNAEVKHRVAPNGSIRFFITPINWISNDTEITIGFDFNYKKCSYSVECACGHPNCELKYWMIEEARRKKLVTSPLDEYEAFMYNPEHLKPNPIMSKPHKKRGRAAKILNTSNRQIMDRPVAIDANPPPVVRRNKRGRPPLNRQNGIQRADVKASSDSSSNNCLTEFKEISDNESVPCRTNENIHPSLSLHSNFKNFKRISSSHWSLKAHRKLCANKTKPTKSYKPIVPQKVGRPVKHKKEKVVESKKDVDLSSEPASSPERYNGTEKSFDNNANISSNEEYETNILQYSHEMKHEMTREEEGKYWLEEINNKIYKQKLKEAKKIKRKSRMDKKLSRKITNFNSHKIYAENVEIEQVKEIVPKESPEEYKEEIVKEEVIETHSQAVAEVFKEKRNISVATPVKAKRGRKSFKNNKSYIVSYKTSNIDDLKNDLMLISASLKEEPEEEPNIETEIVCQASEKSKDECIIEPTPIVEAEGSEKNFSDSFETKKSSTEVESFIDSSDEKLLAAYKSKHRKLHSCKIKDGMKDPMKGSREERWVNIMWQRILKNENSDSKSKRKRSKSSFADESNQSEENANESNDLASPKFGDSDFCDDNLSCENKESDNAYRLNSAHSMKRKPNKFKSSSFSDSDKLQAPEKQLYSKSNETDNHVKVEYSNNSSIEESEKANVSSNEQCGLIVYKEQQSNPMEKFSRENSAKMFNESYNEGGNSTSTNNPSVQHPPHAKKRWLSQALLEENLNEASETTTKETNNTLNDAFIEKFISIDNSSKHSFLPPVITSVDNAAFSLTPPKVAMNPKKRLLNQFSMEDNAFKISSSEISSFNKSNNKWDQNVMDQEQSKTKLTLSEYRKRRYCDKANKNESNLSLKISKKTCDSNDSEWVGISDKYGLPVKETVDESGEIESYNSAAYLETIKKLKTDSPLISQSVTIVTEPVESNADKNSSLSYLNTLNNLKMPGNLDPRLTKSTAFLNRVYINRNQSDTEPSSLDNNNIPIATYSHVELCPRSPSKSPNSPGSEWRMSNFNDRGPRTPSDIDELSINPNNDNDCLSIYAPSQRSIDSFESQPSPTSDCHFDFDRSENNFDCKNKSINCDTSGPNDWTSHSASIARMAGMPNPDLLQEIEEFDDEYVPLPDNLPERSKEEMETLLLTQKRDSQIREWQEVKQLEREKVKLEHQVRSMQRRNQRVTKPNDATVKAVSMMKSSIKSVDHQSNGDQKFPFSLMTTTTDERTMKTFNVQLSNFNDKLLEQINLVKNNNKPLKPPSQNADLPLSYRLSDDIIISSDDTKKSIPTPDDLDNSTANPTATATTTATAATTSNQLSNPKLRKRNNEKTINPQVSEIDQSHLSILHGNSGGGTYSICSQPAAPPHAQFHGGIQKSSEVVSSIIISDHVPTFKSMTSAFM